MSTRINTRSGQGFLRNLFFFSAKENYASMVFIRLSDKDKNVFMGLEGISIMVTCLFLVKSIMPIWCQMVWMLMWSVDK